MRRSNPSGGVLTSKRLEGLWRSSGHGLDLVRDRRCVSSAHGSLQHAELKRTVGDITQRVLTQTLRSLERDGYVIRTVHPTSPPTVEYRLTKMGESLLKPMTGLVAWANQHFNQVMDSRKRYDVRVGNLTK